MEIVAENNCAVRTKRVRVYPKIPISQWKVVKRHRLGEALLAMFCRQEGLSVEELRARSHAVHLVAARRRFARICRSNKVGRMIVAKLLHRDQSTIAAYLSDKIVADKIARNRRIRESRNSLRVADNYETVQP